MEKIRVVDENDNELGLKEKEECHKLNGILHRAITVFIFNNQGHLLITKRSKNKILWPEIWETSCSTHVHENETYGQSAEERIKHELNVSSKLKVHSKFKYSAIFKEIGSENEICALLTGHWNKEIKPNQNEVSEYKWISLDDLKEEIKENPEQFAPWLKIALEEYSKSCLK